MKGNINDNNINVNKMSFMHLYRVYTGESKYFPLFWTI